MLSETRVVIGKRSVERVLETTEIERIISVRAFFEPALERERERNELTNKYTTVCLRGLRG